MLRQITALIVVAALASSGCASTVRSASHGRPGRTPIVASQDILADYVQKLPAGSRVHVERSHGGTVAGTLMGASETRIVVQKRTRVPEPPMEIPLDTVTRVTLDSGGTSLGKAIAIGAGVGAGATLGFLMILAALIGD